MVIKKGSIVLIKTRIQYPSRQKVVGEVTWVDLPNRRYPRYHVRFLSKGDVGCASLFFNRELIPAGSRTCKKYNAEHIQKLFGVCNKQGCTDTCRHHKGWLRVK